MGFVPEPGQSIGISEIFWSFIWRFTLFIGFLDRIVGADAFDGGLRWTAYSGLLIWQGRALFWYISNVTFLLGMLLAPVRKAAVKGGGVFVSVTASGTCGRNVFCHQNGAGESFIRDPSAGRKNPQRSACRADLDVSDGAGLRIFA